MTDHRPDPAPGEIAPEPEETEVERATIRAQRFAKLDRLRAEGVDPYPHRFDRDRTLAELREAFGHLEAGAETDVEVRVAGRLMLKRDQGRLSFGQLRDRSGEVQLFVSAGVIGKERLADFDDLDRGDWIGVEGTVMVTKKGELSVKVSEFTLLAKALRPLPDKWKGLSDVDLRFRQRYVDLVVNDDARRVFEVRVAALDALRQVLRDRGYLEVETPVLHLQQGGATARPFVTHYNALDLDTYLRIALELPLKRLLVGGFERVYEIGRVFRNEGIDTRHNPEFTMLEAYEAFGDYHEMIDLTEALVAARALAANGVTTVECRGRSIDLAGPWRRVTHGRADRGDRRRRHPPGHARRRRPGRARRTRSRLAGRLGGRPVHPRGVRRAGRTEGRSSPPSSSTTHARRHRWPRPTVTTPPSWSASS